MPRFLEKALEKEAVHKGFKGRRAKRYIYGAMNNMNAMHGNKITERGEEIERKHNARVAPSRRRAR